MSRLDEMQKEFMEKHKDAAHMIECNPAPPEGNGKVIRAIYYSPAYIADEPLRQFFTAIAIEELRRGGEPILEKKEMIATQIVFWPGEEVPACDEHAEKLKAVGKFMGFTVSSRAIDGEQVCTNCENEAKKNSNHNNVQRAVNEELG